MNRRHAQILKDLTAWFDDPPIHDFVGVAVFQRIKAPLLSGHNRVGVAVDAETRDIYLRKGMDQVVLPRSCQVSRWWNTAPMVGYADTLESAFEMITGESLDG